MIEIKDCRKVIRFKDLHDGTFFMYGGNFYLKIPYVFEPQVFETGHDSGINCYCLSFSRLSYISFNAIVQPVDVDVIIKRNM